MTAVAVAIRTVRSIGLAAIAIAPSGWRRNWKAWAGRLFRRCVRNAAEMTSNGHLPFISIDHVQLAMPMGGEDQAHKFYVDLLGMREVPKPSELAKRGGCWFE